MRKLRELEGMLIRVESALAVALVLTMLTLAGYNVVYRNVLVPLQVYWAHSGPPIESEASPEVAAETTPEAKPETPKPEAKADEPEDKSGGDDFGGFGGGFDGDEEDDAKAVAEPEKKEAGDDFGGFGGGFDEDEEEPAPEPKPEPEAAPPAPKPEPKASDDFGGFGGGFGEDEEEQKEPPKVAKAEPAPAGDDGFGGFGGGFGEDEGDGEADADDGGAEGFGGFGGDAAKGDEAGEDDLGEDDLGDDDFGDDEDMFANLPSIDAVAKPKVDEGPVGGPPPEGSFAAKGIEFIDAIKLDWIDVFLRQLVIMVAFLGAGLATQRRKHINIDALSKILPASAQRVIPVGLNLVSLYVCIMLAGAGWDLVKIGQEYPNEILPWAEEWQIQLMFPVGFGLLAFHFAIRLVESIIDPGALVQPEIRAKAEAPAAAEPEPAAQRDSEPDSEAVTKNDGRPPEPSPDESSDEDDKGGSN